MYKIAVPIMNHSCQRYGQEAMLEEVKKFDAQRVFLALGYYQLDPESRRKDIDTLRENCRFFRAQGYEVGAWIWAFGFEDGLPFTPMKSLDGFVHDTTACPMDEAYLAFAEGYVRDIAGTGVDIIMYDDDLAFGIRGQTPCCLCDLHIAEINRITGETHDRAQLERLILDGGKSKYRDAWLRVNGDALRTFATRMRQAVDAVDPAIRMGACSVMSSWDVDGLPAPEMAKLLAGNTKPFHRLIGAPYWAVNRSWSNSVQDVVELERMESAWSRFEGLELFAEGDAYPRPRISCPAAYLEGFDTAIRASGCTDGILKYGVDYASAPGYENGYAIMHARNRSLYAGIDRLFGGKQAAGIRVYEYAQKVAEAEFPTMNGVGRLDHLFFSVAARMLAYNAIPTTYEGAGVTGIAFGENARHLPSEAFKKGLILDVTAAKILQARGIDAGLRNVGGKVTPAEERFLSGNHIALNDSYAYDITVSRNAEILSVGGDVPLSYRYENAAGQRFLVLNLVTDVVSRKAYIWRHYARGRQITENMQWLSGETLPAYAAGSPGLYLQCKEGADSMTVGLWNFHPDPAFTPVVRMAQSWSRIEYLNTDGTLEGNQVHLAEIPPFGFAAFTVHK